MSVKLVLVSLVGCLGESLGKMKTTNSSVFEVYWNLPTQLCHEMSVTGFRRGPAVMGFRQNVDDTFFGDKINILYSPGRFPRVEHPNRIVNGGVPQAANLALHLRKFEEDVNVAIPNVTFDGLAIISFHEWRPLWRLNGWPPGKLYKKLAAKYELSIDPTLTDHEVLNVSKVKFDAFAAIIFNETLAKAKTLRPRALWGYEGFPLCYNIKGSLTVHYRCKRLAFKANDELYDRFYKHSTALYPSTFLDENVQPDWQPHSFNRSAVIYQRVMEAMSFSHTAKPAYMYIRPRYGDTNRFLSREDLIDNFVVPCEYGMKGVILWERSEELNTPATCRSMYKYLTSTVRDALQVLGKCTKRRIAMDEARGKLKKVS